MSAPDAMDWRSPPSIIEAADHAARTGGGCYGPWLLLRDVYGCPALTLVMVASGDGSIEVREGSVDGPIMPTQAGDLMRPVDHIGCPLPWPTPHNTDSATLDWQHFENVCALHMAVLKPDVHAAGAFRTMLFGKIGDWQHRAALVTELAAEARDRRAKGLYSDAEWTRVRLVLAILREPTPTGGAT